ncbi:SLC13 family permease [Corynebacterium uterequi]|uniref:Sodium-dependent dicarboxylate transporter SdcS n=1 Tax=Corynebacterium uterequi TaxID=1072256 RepID=A0A0G3HGA0_9CORY|nr:DASS family sodium-coupled anion symporter [Corynebacterium uterequi]AKK10137.1 anion transporter [Corynebacterium uterequi]
MSTPVSATNFITEEYEEDNLDRATWHRQAVGLVGGTIVAALAYFFFPDNAADLVTQSAGADPEVTYSQHALRVTAAATLLMAAWWMTEAIPLAATALVPLAIFPIMQVASFGEVSAPYASSTIFLFLGGFLLALGLQKWNIHRRMALAVVLLVGTSPKRLILGFMLATGFLSMWVSNTATAVVMLPIGTSVLTLTAESVGGWRKQKNFATALMLAIAYSASTGSLGTIIGTPPNTLLVAYLKEAHDLQVGFGQWMLLGVPIALTLTLAAWGILITVFKPEMKDIPGGRALIREEIAKLGAWTPAQIIVTAIFALAALAWVFVPLAIDYFGLEFEYHDAVVGIVAGLLMFAIPANPSSGIRILDWETANELPWDVLLLFGGGLSLSAMFSTSGLSLWVGEISKGLGGLPVLMLIFVVTILILVLTEFTSNTATAATFLPIMGGVATGIGLTAGGNEQNVLLLTIPVALAATCAFMMPVATPPNAIAYGSGYVKIGDMIKGGAFLNIVAIFLITAAVYLVAIPVFGIVL